MVLTEIEDFIVKIIVYAFSFLPVSPLQQWIKFDYEGSQFEHVLNYLNWFFPCHDIVVILQVVLGVYLAYLVFKKIMMVVKGAK